MGTFRVTKNNNYTVMSNHHFKNIMNKHRENQGDEDGCADRESGHLHRQIRDA